MAEDPTNIQMASALSQHGTQYSNQGIIGITDDLRDIHMVAV